MANAKKPNILVIFIDDMGWMDLGCYGSSFYKTPHIDQLAKEGLMFTDGYTAAAVCSPTRASLVTGKYPARLKMTDWIPGGRPKNRKLLVPDWQRWLPESEITTGELFQKGGYRTAWLGKWHLRGLPTDEVPDPATKDPMNDDPQRDHGYEVGVQNWYYNQDKRPEDPKGVDALTEEAIAFIKDTPDKPWFLTLSHYSVHTPVRYNEEVRLEYKKNYKGQIQFRAAYAAMIDALDKSVGKLMSFLKEQNLDEETLIIFLSDNGGVSGWTNNAPLRAGKGTFYEGGVRVPFIARWPGRIRAGEKSSEMVCSVDIYPTIAKVAGIEELPENLDGIDISDHLFKGRSLERDTLYWHYPHYHRGHTPAGAIRKGNYKLVEHFETGAIELYDLSEDLSESKDLREKNPKIAEELYDDLKAWRKKIGAQMMKANPNAAPEEKKP